MNSLEGRSVGLLLHRGGQQNACTTHLISTISTTEYHASQEYTHFLRTLMQQEGGRNPVLQLLKKDKYPKIIISLKTN